MKPLASRTVRGAVVHPVITRDDHPGKLLMGVFDESGDYVEGTATDRRSGLQGVPVPAELRRTAHEATTPEAIYAGDLHMHFGHFLLESLARIRYASLHPEIPIVWTADHGWRDESFRPWQLEILDILGISNPLLFVTAPTRFATLHVPDIGYRYDDWIHPDHARFLARHTGPRRERGRRVWLSRSAIGSAVRDLAAEAAERHLRRAGWFVVHPERLTVRRQLDELARAETVAGEEGSAFHALLLLHDVSDMRLRVVRRRGPEHRNFRTIGDARGVRQDFHSLTGERILRSAGREVTKVSRNGVALLDALDVPRALPVPPRPGDRAVAALARSLPAKRMLEIGARTAYASATGGAATALVVSTRLEDDPRAYPALAGRIDELAFPQYVELFVERPGRYDLIRISGDAVEEVLRDFEETARFSDRETVWAFDADETGAHAVSSIARLPGFVVERMRLGKEELFAARRAPGDGSTG